MITEILVLLVSIALALYFYLRRPNNFPPGPSRLPILGNLLSLGTEPHKTFMEMGEKYGNIFSIYFGNIPGIILNDYKVIKDGFNESSFSARPPLVPFLERSGGVPRGVIFTSGQHWTEQRRFVLKNLRDFGFGKKSMEDMVQTEIIELIENFKKEVGKPMKTQNKFNAAVLNALWSIVTGQRYSHDDPRLGDLIKRLTSRIAEGKTVGALLFFPWVFKFRKAFPWLFGASASNTTELLEKSTGFMKESINEHKRTYEENSMVRDFIDVYWKEIQKTKDPNSSFFGEEGEYNLVVVMLDLFVAGAETTSTTLSWAFLVLALNPKEQERLHEEIRDVVGMSRLPSLSDRPKMPYTEAVIMEIQRYSAMVPLGVFHYSSEEVKNFHGYTIPKDTLVISNLYGALRDPKVWGDPDVFRPARFLSPDQKTVIKNEALIPFSIGKRVCLGETLARDELFLFMTSLFQRFQVTTDPNGPKPKIDYFSAAVLIPKPHDLVLIDRFETSN